MKKLWPYLLVTLIFGLVLNLSKPTYEYVNTHDEDDNIVSGFLMSRSDYQLGRDIFSHHLPGAYLISEVLDRAFQPQGTQQSVFVHRSFVTIWNYAWAILTVFIFGAGSLWLVAMVELVRALYLSSLFHAENLVLYPMIYLLLSLFWPQKIRPVISGIAAGLIGVLLAPLWPLIAISIIQFGYLKRRDFSKIMIGSFFFLLPVGWALLKIDVRECVVQFFGYNALTYAPMVMKKPGLFSLAAFLAPGMVLFDFSGMIKTVIIQALILFLFVFNFKKVNIKKLVIFGVLLGIIGFRSTPRFRNGDLDFHVLPWVVALASFTWYKYFLSDLKRSRISWTVMLMPIFLFGLSPGSYFPSREKAGHMVIRYEDNSPVVQYLNLKKKGGDTLFTLPAHTLLYQQTGIKPFNKFLFYLPWMEKSMILYSDLLKSFDGDLPTFIFIDSINFPYFPPEEIRKLLVNYREVKVTEGEPPIYVLKN